MDGIASWLLSDIDFMLSEHGQRFNACSLDGSHVLACVDYKH